MSRPRRQTALLRAVGIANDIGGITGEAEPVGKGTNQVIVFDGFGGQDAAGASLPNVDQTGADLGQGSFETFG